MKNILHVTYVCDCNYSVGCEYNVDELEAGQHILGHHFCFDILEKDEYAMTVKWGDCGVIAVTKNGEVATIYSHGSEACDDGSRFEAVESLHFSWRTQEE